MSSRVYLVDTSVFCNLLDIPGRNQRKEEAESQFKEYIANQGVFYLPLATIFETGNHIAHIENGNLRRKAAGKFVDLVRNSLAGETPFHPLHFWNNDEMMSWLEQFADYAIRECGFGDFTIIKDYERLCKLQPDIPSAQPIEIWSFDEHLQGYSRP